jgi:hypothetical protein
MGRDFRFAKQLGKHFFTRGNPGNIVAQQQHVFGRHVARNSIRHAASSVWAKDAMGCCYSAHELKCIQTASDGEVKFKISLK